MNVVTPDGFYNGLTALSQSGTCTGAIMTGYALFNITAGVWDSNH